MYQKKITQKFKELYGSEPLIVRSPGRINLIGEHTDYNDGFVMPASIDKSMWFAIALNGRNESRFYAIDIDESLERPLAKGSLEPTTTSWANYLFGVAHQFHKAGIETPNMDVVFGGNIPTGSGLSSSAALSCGFGWALNHILKQNFSRQEIATFGQKAEHEFAAVKCGIMDQFANMFGKDGYLIKLDCRSLGYEYIPFKSDSYSIVLCNTKVHHSLASSEYNFRRKECEEAVGVLSQHYEAIHALRDATMEQLDQVKSKLRPIVYQRARFVIEENLRVEKAVQLLKEDQLEAFGALMFRAHQGLSKEYEVSCPELDHLVDFAKSYEGVVGSRMMGGGFGGCTINLVKENSLDDFKEKVAISYNEAFEIEPDFYVVDFNNATEIVRPYF